VEVLAAIPSQDEPTESIAQPAQTVIKNEMHVASML